MFISHNPSSLSFYGRPIFTTRKSPLIPSSLHQQQNTLLSASAGAYVVVPVVAAVDVDVFAEGSYAD